MNSLAMLLSACFVFGSVAHAATITEDPYETISQAFEAAQDEIDAAELPTGGESPALNCVIARHYGWSLPSTALTGSLSMRTLERPDPSTGELAQVILPVISISSGELSVYASAHGSAGNYSSRPGLTVEARAAEIEVSRDWGAQYSSSLRLRKTGRQWFFKHERSEDEGVKDSYVGCCRSPVGG